MNANQSKVSPAQRASNFAQMTRSNWQMLPSVTGAENSTVQIQIPKVRLTSRIRLEVTATVTATHASSTTFTLQPLAPYNIFNRITVDMNNGFSPFSLSGRELYMYNLMRENDALQANSTTAANRGMTNIPNVSSSGGTANTTRFMMDLPLSLNDRDPVGLILTQNQETTVTVTLNFGTYLAMLATTSGFTIAPTSIVVTPFVESFSIPANPDAFPDLSVLKLVQSTRQTIAGAGQTIVKLPVGMTYRKLVILIEDNASIPVGIADAAFSGNFDLVFNQADVPYSIKPSVLAAINTQQFNGVMPLGVYAFDFSYQGMANYGGARDYIDTEKLTEFWLRFNATAAGTVTCVYEMLSRLR